MARRKADKVDEMVSEMTAEVETTEQPVVKQDPHTKFKSVAQKRTEKALNAIKMVGQLSKNSTMHYEEEDVQKIHDALVMASAKMKEKMIVPEEEPEQQFVL